MEVDQCHKTFKLHRCGIWHHYQYW